MLKPLPYQKEGVRFLERRGGNALLADDMGLGKTLQVLWTLRRNPKWMPAVVVCPAAVKYVWEHEALVNAKVPATVLEGQRPPRGGLLGKPKLSVINYDILHYWVEYLRGLNARTLILDECQMISNARTKRADAVYRLAYGVPRLICVSGTPFMNRPYEFFNALNLVAPERFPSRFEFGHAFCGARRTVRGWEYRGATNKKELRRLITPIMIRRRKKDVLTDLPPKLRQVTPVPMRRPKEYMEARDNFLVWLNKTHGAAKALRAQKTLELVRMGYLLRLAAKLKLKAVLEWVETFYQVNPPGTKLVLMAKHKKFLRAIRKRHLDRSVVVDGGVTGRHRAGAVAKFQQDKRCTLLLGNIQAAGVGLTLTAASNLAFGELPWRPADLTQAEDRIHRIGQTRGTLIHYLVAKGTIEEWLVDLLQRKQAIQDAILNGLTPRYSDFDLHEKLLEALHHEKTAA